MYASTIGGGAMTVVFRASEPVVRKTEMPSQGLIAAEGNEEKLPANKRVVPANTRPRRRKPSAGKKTGKMAA